MEPQQQQQQHEEEKNDAPALAAARAAAPGGGVVDATQAALENMQAYIERSACSKVLQDLYEKIVVEQPEDPVAFLIDAVEEHRRMSHK